MSKLNRGKFSRFSSFSEDELINKIISTNLEINTSIEALQDFKADYLATIERLDRVIDNHSLSQFIDDIEQINNKGGDM